MNHLLQKAYEINRTLNALNYCSYFKIARSKEEEKRYLAEEKQGECVTILRLYDENNEI
jgi:hypothetical protein